MMAALLVCGKLLSRTLSCTASDLVDSIHPANVQLVAALLRMPGAVNHAALGNSYDLNEFCTREFATPA
jgi:hypothetical protein